MVLDQTELPQRQLAQELRFAIDDARRSGRTTQLARLLEDNPRGVRSTHVQYALGQDRRRWLEAFQQGWGDDR